MTTIASLTPEAMRKIKTAIDAPASLVDAFVGAVRCTFEALGVDWSKLSLTNKLQVSDYKIPEQQWSEISRWIGHRANQIRGAQDFLAGVTAELEWVNRGPSFFYDNEELTLDG